MLSPAMSLLIVDDDAINRKLLRAQLEAEGHRVLDAINGLEALEILERKPVDGIISDILMPDMDGYRLCLEVRKKKKTSTVPFIFYTSTYSSPQDRKLAQTVGADNYLSKPSPIDAILGALGEAMQKTRPRIARVVKQHDETYVLKQYNASLVNKLEQRNSELEQTLAQLQESEERFRAAFEQAGVGMALRGIDPRNSRWLRVNQKLCDILGYSRYELLQMTSLDVTPPEDRGPAVEYSEKLLRGDIDSYSREKRYQRKDGRIVWVQLTVTVVKNANGKPDHLISVIEDITDRKESQQRFQTIFEQAGIGIAMRPAGDRHAPWEQVNDHFCRLLGYTREELLATVSTATITPDDETTSAVNDNQRLLKGEISNYSREKKVVRKDGSRIWVLLTVASLPGPEGRPAKLISTYQDITRRKEAELGIRRLNRVYAMLSGISALITRTSNLNHLLGQACHIAVAKGNFDLAWIGRVEPGASGIVPLAWAGEHAGELIKTDTSANNVSPLGAGVTGHCIQKKQPVFDNDLAATPDIGSERRRTAIRLGYRAAIGLPLTVDGEVINVLTLYTKDKDFFDREEVTLLTELAGNISVGMESIARRQKLTKLSRIRAVSSEINAAIVRIRDRNDLLKEACRITLEQGHIELAWIGYVDQQKKEVRSVAWSGFPDELIQQLTWNDFGADKGALRQAMETRKPYIRKNINEGPPLSKQRQYAADQGYSSSACLPLEVDEQVVAIILLFAREIAFFNGDELALMKEVTADLSYALQTIANQEKFDYLSYYDTLTGLPNRTLFMDRASQQLHLRGGEPRMVALFLLNLERFRYINDTFGRHGGDELLKLVARRLKNIFQGNDYLARIGADGFGIILRGIKDSTQILHVLENQVLDCFREPFRIDSSEVRVSAKTGVAVFPSDGNNADELYRNAEAALKLARQSGERYLFYAAEMNARAVQTLTLETKLRKAVDAQEFVLHYQPKYSLLDGKICGMEALIRWQDPTSGLVPPGMFIPLLEETGLILQVGEWALNHALAQHCEWTEHGLTVPRIAVNVSAIQLQQKNFMNTVIDAVQAQGDNADSLELEITESLLMRNVQASIQTLSVLRGLGVTIAMDDFGTGYSSLAYLERLPITSVKIDRAFISGMADTSQSMNIVTTIITLAHSMKLKVVAEGVETQEQARLLKLMKCDEVQGYFFSKPLPAPEIQRLLESDNRN